MAAITVLAISKCVGVTTTGTYTYTVSSGPAPLVGTPIIVTGFVTNPNFNGFLRILTLVNTSGVLTFTATIPSTTATETISATGTYDPEGPQSYPTADSLNPYGFGVLTRQGEGLSVPLGNAQGGSNISGIGQIYPTGQQ